jgi:hypothetical protein
VPVADPHGALTDKSLHSIQTCALVLSLCLGFVAAGVATRARFCSDVVQYSRSSTGIVFGAVTRSTSVTVFWNRAEASEAALIRPGYWHYTTSVLAPDAFVPSHLDIALDRGKSFPAAAPRSRAIPTQWRVGGFAY